MYEHDCEDPPFNTTKNALIWIQLGTPVTTEWIKHNLTLDVNCGCYGFCGNMMSSLWTLSLKTSARIYELSSLRWHLCNIEMYHSKSKGITDHVFALSHYLILVFYLITRNMDFIVMYSMANNTTSLGYTGRQKQSLLWSLKCRSFILELWPISFLITLHPPLSHPFYMAVIYFSDSRFLPKIIFYHNFRNNYCAYGVRLSTDWANYYSILGLIKLMLHFVELDVC